MAVTLYCSEDDLANWMSDFAIALRVSDDPPDSLGRTIELASVRINWYCLERYEAAQLALSECIRAAATVIAVNYICARRANPVPGVFKEFYNELTKEKTGLLWEVREGKRPIPDATPRRAAAPVMSNVTWRQWPTQHGRVRKGTSTGTVTSYGQRKDHLDAGNFGLLDYSI